MRAEPRGRSNRPSTDLPAPYRSPWKRLGADLEAVGADLVLRARELWRRNREGSLWRPRFWPRAVAAGFWPLVLAAVLVLAALVVGLGVRRGPTPPVPAAQGERAAPMAAPAASSEPPEPSLPPASLAPSAIAGEPAAEPETADLARSEPELEPEPDPASEPDLESEADREPVPVPSPQPGRDEALQAEFAALDAPGVIAALRADAATAVLRIEVGEGFARLEPRRRRRLAEDWAVRAADRGYERLEVVDGRGRLWARPAAVGDGLVVLGYPVEPEPG